MRTVFNINGTVEASVEKIDAVRDGLDGCR